MSGYPFWIERTDGARFNDAEQKQMYAQYLEEGAIIERGDLDVVCTLAKNHSIAVYLGIMERARQNLDQSGHYSRPDVLELSVNRKRQSIVTFQDE